jgi:hypothetical protein
VGAGGRREEGGKGVRDIKKRGRIKGGGQEFFFGKWSQHITS